MRFLFGVLPTIKPYNYITIVLFIVCTVAKQGIKERTKHCTLRGSGHYRPTQSWAQNIKGEASPSPFDAFTFSDSKYTFTARLPDEIFSPICLVGIDHDFYVLHKMNVMIF